jgi:predicted lipoprotein with Yx(FWY)xxD motif
VVKVGTTAKGAALTDNAGLSLYTFDNDKTPGTSSCSGGCATTWPPVTTTAATAPSGVTGASGAFSVLTRGDGAKQIAYNGAPLYRYAADKAPGDTTGDGVGNIWHLAKP